MIDLDSVDAVKPFVIRTPVGTILVAILGVMLIAGIGCRPFGTAPGVTASRIRALTPGMSEPDVRALLGDPLDVRPWGVNSHLLDYARETPFAHHSPILWVLILDGRVDQVEAYRGNLWHLDKEGIYVRRPGFQWEAPVFARTFK